MVRRKPSELCGKKGSLIAVRRAKRKGVQIHWRNFPGYLKIIGAGKQFSLF